MVQVLNGGELINLPDAVVVGNVPEKANAILTSQVFSNRSIT